MAATLVLDCRLQLRLQFYIVDCGLDSSFRLQTTATTSVLDCLRQRLQLQSKTGVVVYSLELERRCSLQYKTCVVAAVYNLELES